MRSRPTVRLWHGPNVVPGAKVPVTLELNFKTETPVDSVAVELNGHEYAGAGSGNQHRSANWKSVSRVCALPRKTYEPGVYKYDLLFDIPEHASPSHVGTDVRIRYELFVRVAIPWWPDRTAAYDMPVGFPLMQPYPPKPIIYTTRDQSVTSADPAIELSVDTMDASIDETISGQISVSDLGSRTCRGVDIAIVQLENLREPYAFTRSTTRFGWRIYHGRPPEGETLPFSVRLPHGLHPTFEGRLYGAGAILEVKCDIALGTDIVLRAPLVLHPPLATPRRLTQDLIQPVGSGRLHRVFSVVAGRLGLVYEQAGRSLNGRAAEKANALTFTIGLQHEQDGYHRVARFDFAPLGVGFVIERKDTKNLFGLTARDAGAIPGYLVSARDPEQVQRLALAIGARAARYDHLEASDRHVRLSEKGDASTVQALSTFALQAINFANEIAESIAALPAPLGLGPHVPAWQAYAEQTGGAFTRTAMRIDGARVGFDGLRVETHFAVHGVPTDTTFTLTLDPPLSLPPGGFDVASPSLSANARTLAKGLIAGRGVEITDNEITASVPGAVPDPAVHGPLVDRLAALAAALRGQVAQIPYR